MSRKKPSFLNRLRTYTALISTFVLNLGSLGITFRKGCSPGLVCHGCPWATGACPVGTSAFSSALGRFPTFAVSSILLIGALMGRLICGFVCPFGFLQDIMHRIPSKKFVLPRWTRYIKYAVLALLVFIFPYLLGFKPTGYLMINKATTEKKAGDMLGLTVTVTNSGTGPVISPTVNVVYNDRKSGKPLQGFAHHFTGTRIEPGTTLVLPVFEIKDMLREGDMLIASPQSTIEQSPRVSPLYYCKICPNGTLTATLPSYFAQGAANTLYAAHFTRFAILFFFLVLMVLVSRAFCQTFCPLGALYAITAPFSLLRTKLDRDLCINCGACDRVCPVNLDVRKEVGGPECISCGDCIKTCPKKALSRRFGVQ